MISLHEAMQCHHLLATTCRIDAEIFLMQELSFLTISDHQLPPTNITSISIAKKMEMCHVCVLSGSWILLRPAAPSILEECTKGSHQYAPSTSSSSEDDKQCHCLVQKRQPHPLPKVRLLEAIVIIATVPAELVASVSSAPPLFACNLC
jgi:hypothetical protein